jgi:hypothetical protein
LRLAPALHQAGGEFFFCLHEYFASHAPYGGRPKTHPPPPSHRFTAPFTWDLWLAILLTILIFPLAILIIEFGSLRRAIPREQLLPAYKEASVRTIWTTMSLDAFIVSSTGARLAALCLGFFRLVVMLHHQSAALCFPLTVFFFPPGTQLNLD